ncbi:uncharacterized protein LOC124776475 [Schistocerca piceifrons]|nr:uncharacterized protein LOC124776475 [Schistocerca piceifrons]XP_049950708.1 uncharacterized protein LOC126457986 [Schistocerca serialis cubense]
MLAVLAIVLACNRHSKPDPDWNAARGSPPPVVVKGGGERAGDRSCSYSSVQQYVDSLPVELDAPGSLLSLHSLGRDRAASAAPSAHSGSPRTAAASAGGPAASFSMEDLLFLD